MASLAEIAGEEAYQLYCRSRFGDPQCFSEFERKCSEALDSAVRLTWQGYYANALFYSLHNKEDPDRAKCLCKSIFPALKAVVDESSAIGTASPHLQYLLAWCYHNSLGVPLNNKEAARLFRLASDQGLAIAQSNLGICYDDGDGVPQDRAHAARLYRKGANKNHAPAQYNLGLSFYYGNGLPQNVTEGAKLFRLAADQGFSAAQYMLGDCYDRGLGVEQDILLAIHWYSLAVKQGYADAQLALGLCYQYGDGVSQNLDEAARLLRLAAKQGTANAQYFYAQFLSQYFCGDDEEAISWYRLAAAQDFPQALFELGKCYELGLNVDVDVIEAVKWYTKAATMNAQGASEALKSTHDAYIDAIWNNRKGFLLFLAQYQFIYRPPAPPVTAGVSEEDIRLAALTLTQIAEAGEDPDVVHTVFHTEDMRREIMSFL